MKTQGLGGRQLRKLCTECSKNLLVFVFINALRRIFENQTAKQMSRDMRFPTMWYVRPTTPQISLRIRAV